MGCCFGPRPPLYYGHGYGYGPRPVIIEPMHHHGGFNPGFHHPAAFDHHHGGFHGGFHGGHHR